MEEMYTPAHELDYRKELEREGGVDLLTATNEQIWEQIELAAKENKPLILDIPSIIETANLFFQMFHCQHCGDCCRGIGADKLGILIAPDEIKKLARALGTSRKKFIHKYCNKDTGKIFIRYPCPFLKNNECSIYLIRPRICIQYPLYIPIKYANCDPSIDGIEMMTVNSNCPEARRIAFITFVGRREMYKEKGRKIMFGKESHIEMEQKLKHIREEQEMINRKRRENETRRGL